MKVNSIKLNASVKVMLALTQSGRPMSSVEIMEETGLTEWSFRQATKELQGLGEVFSTDCTRPDCGKALLEFRLTHPLIPYVDTDILEQLAEADGSGDDERKVKALETLFARWFPKQDGWGKVYRSDIRRMLVIAGGFALTVYEDLEASGANPDNRDRDKIRTRDDIALYCINTLRNKRDNRNGDRQPYPPRLLAVK